MSGLWAYQTATLTAHSLRRPDWEILLMPRSGAFATVLLSPILASKQKSL